jgi:hypothetical protein
MTECPHYMPSGSGTTQLWFDLQKDKRCVYCRLAKLEAAVKAIAEDGWLYHGPEGMSDTQEAVYDCYLEIKNIRRIGGGTACGFCGFALVVDGPRQCCKQGSQADGEANAT